MAGDSLNRRNFLKRASGLTAAGTAFFSFEEQILHAFQERGQQPPDRFNLRNQPPAPDVPGPISPDDLGNSGSGGNRAGKQSKMGDVHGVFLPMKLPVAQSTCDIIPRNMATSRLSSSARANKRRNVRMIWAGFCGFK